ncbi:ArsO family NAD(P)H-dependent flavin-containing monooxygenase [Microlunatus spumicola]|uniref:ArsO family NAD(P)H-dependent flavin-containing monooxygenase n=1 Tax=Microlunatus spumicola TaxID=81499 RepID=A0ABP6XKC4_9ACTN
MDVLVVGGGQAALATGYYLQRARRRATSGPSAPGELGRLSFALLDANPSAGGAWTAGWDTLQLFSPAGFSSLPGWPMPPWTGEGNPSAQHVRDYLSAYEDRYQLPVHRPVRVRTVTRTTEGFDVVTDRGVWRCRVLVNATGASRPFWPTYPGMDAFAGRQLHSAGYRSAADFDDQTVLVVGGGNSGAQIAADLTSRPTGETAWVTARPPRFLPDDVDGRKLFELATRRVRAAAAGDPSDPGVGGLGDIVMVPPVLAARRRGDLQAQPMFDRVTPTGVAWNDPPRQLAADAIVWCTGFRPDLRHLAGLALTRSDALPVTDPPLPSRSVDDPGLFFLGYGDWCGPASATLIGVGGVARASVDAIVEQLRELGDRAGRVSVRR